MKKFRGVIFWTHLVSGVLGGIVIFIMCVTGAALSFEKNIVENFEHDQRTVTVSGERLLPKQLLEAVTAAKPDSRPSSLTLQNDPNAAVAISLGREGQIYVDPYNGKITGEGNAAVRGFFYTAEGLHRWIALSGEGRAVGKALTGACNMLFLVLAISGLYIWMPRRLTWVLIKPVIWFRKTSTAKSRDFNWHNTIGFWCSLILVVLTVTAMVISYQWAGNLVYTLTGNEVPLQRQGPPNRPSTDESNLEIPENINELWKAAESKTLSWRSISMRLPVMDEASFTIDEGTSLNIYGRSALTLYADASIKKWEPYAEQNSARQLRSWLRFTHTGESFGIIGQVIGFTACLGGAFLVFTGISLAIRRLYRWNGDRRNANGSTV